MTENEIREMSHDVDDFINKMISVHGLNFACITATILARLAVIAMETNQETGMLKLIMSMQDSLIKSLEVSRRQE
jgi:hypothetical protein